MAEAGPPCQVLIIEPFYGGSHRHLVDYLTQQILPAGGYHLVAMTAKKWHWRARCSALHVSQEVARALEGRHFSHVFCSSVLSLAELLGLCPGLAASRKLVYFHENQLIYPVRKSRGERDFQYGYNQIISALAADLVLFNSEHNRDTFVQGANSFLNAMPDYRTRGLGPRIAAKSRVLHLPVWLSAIAPELRPSQLTDELHRNATELHQTAQNPQASATELHQTAQLPQATPTELHQIAQNSQATPTELHQTVQHPQASAKRLHEADQNHQNTPAPHQTVNSSSQPHFCVTEPQGDSSQLRVVPIPPQPPAQAEQPPLLILWPHRWEHDKNPEAFFAALYELADSGARFEVCVLGQSFAGPPPPAFEEARARLAGRVAHWGFAADRRDYLRLVSGCHVVVSTAVHEFFGLAMLEATAAGCYPLAPRRLAYPELLPDECLYATDRQLAKRLARLCAGGPGLARQLRREGDFRLDRLRPETLRRDYAELFGLP